MSAAIAHPVSFRFVKRGLLGSCDVEREWKAAELETAQCGRSDSGEDSILDCRAGVSQKPGDGSEHRRQQEQDLAAPI